MIYERIRNLREDSDFTQQQIADKLFINRRTYSSYENGVRNMPIEILSKIADIFNTSTDYLIGRTDVKNRILKADNKTIKFLICYILRKPCHKPHKVLSVHHIRA